MVFAKEKYRDAIKNIDYDTVKCGFQNKLGNKGAAVIKL